MEALKHKETLKQARSSFLRSMKNALHAYRHNDEAAKLPIYSAVYTSAQKFGEVYASENGCGNPFFSAVQINNRFHVYGKDPGSFGIQQIRESTFKDFYETFGQFDASPLPSAITPEKVKMEQEKELTSFYIDLSLSPREGFLAPEANFEQLAIADTLFMRGRSHFYAFENMWWWREMSKRDGHNDPAVVDRLYEEKRVMQGAISSLYQLPQKGWIEYSGKQEGGIHKSLSATAAQDYEAMIKSDRDMGYPISDPDSIDLGFLKREPFFSFKLSSAQTRTK